MSIRKCSGALWVTTNRPMTSMSRSTVMERPTSMAKASLVNSSTMLATFKRRSHRTGWVGPERPACLLYRWGPPARPPNRTCSFHGLPERRVSALLAAPGPWRSALIHRWHPSHGSVARSVHRHRGECLLLVDGRRADGELQRP